MLALIELGFFVKASASTSVHDIIYIVRIYRSSPQHENENIR